MDIYDSMPDGDAQRRHNRERLAFLEQDGAERRARIATVLTAADLETQAVNPYQGVPCHL